MGVDPMPLIDALGPTARQVLEIARTERRTPSAVATEIAESRVFEKTQQKR